MIDYAYPDRQRLIHPDTYWPSHATKLADATAYLARRGLWRGAPGCRHEYVNSLGLDVTPRELIGRRW